MNSQFSKNALTQSQNKPTPFNKAYFASKSELLNWASKLLDLELTSLEQLETGAIFCQLLDACHPGSVRLNKLNWKANNETDYISNFKIFQQGLITNNINKPIDINRLIKGKQYDLNELLQWIYGYYLNSRDNVREVYNAKRKRGGQNFVYKNNKIKGKISKKEKKDIDNIKIMNELNEKNIKKNKIEVIRSQAIQKNQKKKMMEIEKKEGIIKDLEEKINYEINKKKELEKEINKMLQDEKETLERIKQTSVMQKKIFEDFEKILSSGIGNNYIYNSEKNLINNNNIIIDPENEMIDDNNNFEEKKDI